MDILYSVIIPAYNSSGTLSDCLAALEAQTVPRAQFEVIVVDDGSTDDTSKVAALFPVHLILQANRGPAAARNRGARAARGAVLVFTDADCVPSENWLFEMVQPLADPGTVAVKGAYRTRQRSWVARFAQIEFEERYEMLERTIRVDMVDTYAAAYRKDVFLELGGFDEAFPAPNGEDLDLSYRLEAAGHRLAFNPRALVFHTHPARLRTYLRLKYSRAYWRVMVYRRYPGKVARDSYTPVLLKLQTVLFAGMLPLAGVLLLTRNAPLALTIFAGVMLVLSLSLTRRAWTRDRAVALVTPGLVLLRAGALAFGSIVGVIRHVLLRRWRARAGERPTA